MILVYVLLGLKTSAAIIIKTTAACLTLHNNDNRENGYDSCRDVTLHRNEINENEKTYDHLNH